MERPEKTKEIKQAEIFNTNDSPNNDGNSVIHPRELVRRDRKRRWMRRDLFNYCVSLGLDEPSAKRIARVYTSLPSDMPIEPSEPGVVLPGNEVLPTVRKDLF